MKAVSATCMYWLWKYICMPITGTPIQHIFYLWGHKVNWHTYTSTNRTILTASQTSRWSVFHGTYSNYPAWCYDAPEMRSWGHRVSQKSSPQKTAIFSLTLSIFLVYFRKILPICCQYISTCSPIFHPFILIFNKIALIFLEILIIFTVSSFEFQRVRLPSLTDY